MKTRKNAAVVEPLLESKPTALALELNRVPTKLKAWQFWCVAGWPINLIFGFSLVLIHDLIARLCGWPNHWRYDCDHFSSNGPALGGLVVEFISRDWYGFMERPCEKMWTSKMAWWNMIVLPIAWSITLYYTFRCKNLSKRLGPISTLTNKHLGRIDCQCETSMKVANDFHRDVRWMLKKHFLYLWIFQATMFMIDLFFFEHTMRMCLAYQIIWLGFAGGWVEVRSTVMYCVLLSHSMLDCYIIRILTHYRPTNKVSWLTFAEEHRKLELDIQGVWVRLQLSACVIGVPFYTMAILHFVSDPNIVTASSMAGFLVVVAGWMTVLVLSRMARVTKQFSSASAYKAEWRPDTGKPFKRGFLSVLAVVRSLVNEVGPSDGGEHAAKDNQDYSTFLEYLHGHPIAVVVGIPSIIMVGVTQGVVSKTFFDFTTKFPLVVTAFVSLRHKWHAE